jgi:hypothetical protein
LNKFARFLRHGWLADWMVVISTEIGNARAAPAWLRRPDRAVTGEVKHF